VFYNSEVEPQLAVDSAHPGHAVAIWQQDRFRSVGGARALVVSVTNNANDNDLDGAEWSTPTPIPWFDATDPRGAAFQRYTDPWVTIAPNGDVYAAALALTPSPSGPFPSHTAVLVSKSTNGGLTWSAPATLIDDQAPPGTDPIDLANDKESITADPTDPTGKTVYVVWDRLNHPGDSQNFNAFHGLGFREDAFFARTTDGGAHWDTTNLTSFQANQSAFGNILLVEPNGDLVDAFTHGNGSGNQAAQADQTTLGVMRSTDKGQHWSNIIDGPAIETMSVTDPDTGAPVRDGEPLVSVAVDPHNGNLYAVWADARFSGLAQDAIAFSMSTNGGRTWSDPIQVNQTPTNIPAGNQQAFTPTVAVASDGTVAVTYYDFRNNTAAAGLPTDYWLVHASSHLTDPSSWSSDEKRLTNASFNIENAAPTSRGYFLGDYQGLAAAGTSFYALFAQAGSTTSDPSNIFFRDPPPAPAAAVHLVGDASGAPTKDVISGDLVGDAAGPVGGLSDTGSHGLAMEGSGQSPDASASGSRLIGQDLSAKVPAADLSAATQAGETRETAALDEAFADLGDGPFVDALAGDAVATPAD
jgi:hypothetical protein